MSAFLYSIGIFAAVVGLLTIGFSIPIRDFSLGNSLIGAGATAIAGGLILIGLGAVVRELRRLARALERSSQPVTRGADAGRALGRMPLPTPAPPLVAPHGRAEPHLGVPGGSEPAHAARQRSDLFAAIRGTGREAPVPEMENVPLSPTLTPRAPAALSRSEAVEESAAQQRLAEPRRPSSPAALASRTASRLDSPRAPEARRAPPDRGAERLSRNLFDTVWPTEPRRAAEQGPEPAMPERPAAAPEHVAMDEQAMPEPAADDTLHAEHEPQRVEQEPAREAPPRQASEPRPVAILKSGVIDGMAYTLYTDGSIEAQLPKGLMRFASIEELRNYLEKNS